MRSDDQRRRLEALSTAVTEALGPTLDEAAETVAAEARRRLGALARADDARLDPETAVAVGRDAEGRTTVSLSAPAAVALEFGTRRTAARPFLRPAIAATHDRIRRLLDDTVRHALSRRRDR